MNQPTKSCSALRSECEGKVPTVRLRFNPSTGGMDKQRVSEPFLKGPISIAWLNGAALLPGKAINVALAIHWLRGMRSNGEIKLTRKSLNFFNVSNDAACDALKRMELAGLVKLHKNKGQRHLIEVLPIRTGI